MTVSTDFATLYSFNANASISRELPKGFVVNGSYLYTKGSHLPVYRNINLVLLAHTWPTEGPFSARPRGSTRDSTTSCRPNPSAIRTTTP